MNTPIKTRIKKAKSQQEWDKMQIDYINREAVAADRIEKLRSALAVICGCPYGQSAVLAYSALQRDWEKHHD
jgi:hypothetical protein